MRDEGEIHMHDYRSPSRGLERFGRVFGRLCAYVADPLTDEPQEQEGKNVVNQDPMRMHDGDKAGAVCWYCGANALISLVAHLTFLYRTRPLKFA
jgi:hypothetical protein